MNKQYKKMPGQLAINHWVVKLLQRLWEKAKRRFAEYLSRKATTTSLEHQRYLLIAFCGTGCSVALFVMIYPFIKSKSGNDWQPASTVLVARKLHQTLSLPIHDSTVRFQQYSKVIHLKGYLDSLQQIPERKNVYDSILMRHPGLLDTLQMLQQLYRSG